MKVALKQSSNENRLTAGKTYWVIGVEADWFRIVNDLGEPCLYAPGGFEMVDSQEPAEWIVTFGGEGEKYACPEAMNAPGFFEDYFDGDETAKAIFRKYINEKVGRK